MTNRWTQRLSVFLQEKEDELAGAQDIRRAVAENDAELLRQTLQEHPESWKTVLCTYGKGAKPKTGTAAHFAVQRGQHRSLALLWEAGDRFTRRIDGMSAAAVAVRDRKGGCLKVMFRLGLKADGEPGHPLLRHCRLNNGRANLEMIQTLLKAGARPWLNPHRGVSVAEFYLGRCLPAAATALLEAETMPEALRRQPQPLWEAWEYGVQYGWMSGGEENHRRFFEAMQRCGAGLPDPVMLGRMIGPLGSGPHYRVRKETMIELASWRVQQEPLDGATSEAMLEAAGEGWTGGASAAGRALYCRLLHEKLQETTRAPERRNCRAGMRL